MASDDIHPRTSDADSSGANDGPQVEPEIDSIDHGFQELGGGATETSPLGVARAARCDQTPVIPGYEIIRELHRGGQGVVYEALQRSAKRKVAIKVMLAGPFSSKAARKRFEREIELVAQLKHPNIIPVFHSGETDQGLPFFVMEYVRGTRLDHYVREKKPPLEEVLSLFAKVCEAVQYAHQRGVIHRDLKPSNIIVDFEGTPRVLDFGLAKLLAGPVETVVSVSAEILGTIPYMSPEQVRGNPDEIDTRSDVYALGVVLYELLTGRLPYPSSSQMAELIRHIAETPPSPPTAVWSTESGVTERTRRRSRPGHCPIDDEVETIVLKALSKDRARRYQSAGELSRDLGHYLAGEPIEARRDSGWYILRSTLRRYRVQAAAGGAAVLILAIVAVGTSLLYRRASIAEAEEVRQRIIAESRAVELEKEREVAVAAERTAKSQAYLANIHAATTAITNGDGLTATMRLDAAPVDLRNWEWHYLHSQVDVSDAVFRCGGRQLRAGAVSPDGHWIAVLDSEGTHVCGRDSNWSDTLLTDVLMQPVTLCWSSAGHRLVLYDGVNATVLDDPGAPQSRQILRASLDFPADAIGLPAIALSQDGTYLAVKGFFRSNALNLSIWDLRTGSPRLQTRTAGPPLFSPVGSTLFIKEWPEILVLDAESPSERRRIAHGTTFRELSVSPDAELLAIGDRSGTIHVRETASGRMATTFRAHSDEITALAFDSDMRYLASSSLDKTLYVRDLSNETGQRLLGSKAPIISLAFVGASIVSLANDGTVQSWSLPAKNPTLVLPPNDGVFAPSVISRDGQLCALKTMLDDIQIYDLVQRRVRVEFKGHTNNIRDMTFSGDGQRFASSSANNDVIVWDTQSGQEIFRQSPAVSPALSRDGDRLMIAADHFYERPAKGVYLWDVPGKKEMLNLPDAYGLIMSDDGKWVVTTGTAGLRIWNADEPAGQPAQLVVDLSHFEIEPCADGFVVYDAKAVHFWRFGIGETCAVDAPDVWHGAARDGTIAASSSGRVLAFDQQDVYGWDAINCKQIVHTRLPTTGTSAAWSPDESRIAVGFRDGTLRLYDGQLNTEFLSLSVGTEAVSSVVFAPDSSAITAVSLDGTLKRWAISK